MEDRVKISIDLMGGDNSPEKTLEGIDTNFISSISLLSIVEGSPISLNNFPPSKLTFTCILPPIKELSSDRGTPTVTSVAKLFQYTATSSCAKRI